MFDGIKRRFTTPPAQANALKVNGDINAPVNFVNLILENGTQITVPLDIKWSATKLQADAAPSQLLHWRTRLTDLLGRDDELAALKAWAQSGVESSQAQVIVGDGGLGKTRLAMELADWLRVNQHWRAGALSLREVSSFRALGAIAGNTLIVVDYPDANPDAVKRLLRAVLESESNKSIKLLFLTREHESMSAVIRDAGAQDLFAPTPLLLMPFADAAYALFCAAFKAVATQSNALPPNRATFATWQSCSPLHSAALFLVAAGISVARYSGVGGASDAIPIGVKLLERMCEDETRKLSDAAEGLRASADAAVDTLAMATLLGDIDFDALVARPEATLCCIVDMAPLRSVLLASGHAVYDNAASKLTIMRLEPDLFGAMFVHQWYVLRRKHGATTAERLASLAAGYLNHAEIEGLVKALNQWNRVAFDCTARLRIHHNDLDRLLSGLLNRLPSLRHRLNAVWFLAKRWHGLPISEMSRHTGDTSISADAFQRMMQINTTINIRETLGGEKSSAMPASTSLATDAQAYAENLIGSVEDVATEKNVIGDSRGAAIVAAFGVSLLVKLNTERPEVFAPYLAKSVALLKKFPHVTDEGASLDVVRADAALYCKPNDAGHPANEETQ